MENNKRRHLDIDLDKPIARIDVGRMMGSGDDEASRFTVGVYRGSTRVDISACAVKGYLIIPNTETLKIDGVVADGVASVTVPKEGYVYDGCFSLAVKIGVDGKENTVAIFDGTIERTMSENIIHGDRVVYGVNDILDLIDDMEQAEEDATDAANSAKSAATAANNAASNANTKASAANTAAQSANNAANYIQNATFAVKKLSPGATPTISTSTVSGHLHAVFGVPQGEKGEQGSPYTIKGKAYATVANLSAAVTNPAEGDQYNVGSAAPYNIYRWTGSGWEDQGKLQGAKGEKGDSPVVGVDYFTADDKQEIVADVLASLPNASGVSF